MIWYLNGDPLTKNQECAVPLGVQGEDNAKTYTADVSDWLTAHPLGLIVLVLQAPDGSEPYMGNTSTDAENGTVSWTVTAFDTAIVGYGRGELRMIAENAVVKSFTFKTYIRPSVLMTIADPPTPVPEWATEILQTAEQTAINAHLAEIAQAGAETAQSAAETAQANAETAQGAAETAQAGAEAAQTAAETAQTGAETAKTGAEAAQAAAEAAEGRADGFARNAGVSATTASNARSAAVLAKDAAETAQGKAEAAQTAAETAKGIAVSAQAAAEAAQTGAVAAKTAAESAQTGAETAKATAVAAQTGAVSAQTAAEVAQLAAETAQTAAEAAQTAAETAQGKAEDAQAAAETAQGKAEDAQTAAETAQAAAEAAAATVDATLIKNSVSGAIVSFTDGADNVPMQSVLVNIDPIQTGADDPSPDNVRPISGRTGLKVTVSRKNLLPIRTTQTSNHGVYYTPIVENGLVTGVKVSGTQDGSASVSNIMPDGQGITLPPGNYIFSGGTDTAYLLLRRDTSGGTNVAESKNGAHTPFTLTENTLIFCNARKSGYSGEIAERILYPMIRKADAIDETFEPYQGNTYAVDWTTEAGTVYGGTLDVVSGVLTVDRVMVTMNGTDQAFNVYGTGTENYIYRYSTGIAAKQSSGAICNKYPTDNIAASNTKQGFTVVTDGTVRIRWGAEDLAAFNASLAVTPLQVCYYIATPQTYQLTPQEVKTLLGVNNVFADSGNISIVYQADTKIYVNERIVSNFPSLIAPVEETLTATRTYAVNDLLIVNNQLYKVVASIANGATITPGTNATATTIGELIKTLL